MVFVLNIVRMINISNIPCRSEPARDEQLDIAGIQAPRVTVDHHRRNAARSKLAPTLVFYFQLLRGPRPDTKWLTSLNPGVDACPGVTSESMNASSSVVIFTVCALV